MQTEICHEAGQTCAGLPVTMLQPLRVLLVEDSPLIAARIQELLADTPGVSLVGTVAEEGTAIAALEREPVDALILDLRLRQGTGFGVLKRAATMPNRPATIIFTNYDLPEYRARAASLGAEHFLDKTRDYDQLATILDAMSRVRN
jgi:DNA-binding NarL/FixJ family response regulator